MKKKFFFFLIILLEVLSLNAYTEEMWVGNTKKLPSEFCYLLESIQKTEFSPAEKQSFTDTLKELDAQFNLMTKEEIFFILKGEIYKALLAHHKNSTEIPLEDTQLSRLNKALLEKGSRLYAFGLWLMIALKSDAEVLLHHPERSQLKLGTKDKELLRLKKKINLISPWIQNFLNMEIDEFHSDLRPLMKTILKRIEITIRLFVLQGRFEKIKLTKENSQPTLSFFTLKEISKAESFTELNNWLRRQSLDKEKPSNSNVWQPKDDGKIPNYLSPKVLPKPADDWSNDSSDTKLPKIMPKPIDDWILD